MDKDLENFVEPRPESKRTQQSLLRNGISSKAHEGSQTLTSGLKDSGELDSPPMAASSSQFRHHLDSPCRVSNQVCDYRQFMTSSTNSVPSCGSTISSHMTCTLQYGRKRLFIRRAKSSESHFAS